MLKFFMRFWATSTLALDTVESAVRIANKGVGLAETHMDSLCVISRIELNTKHTIAERKAAAELALLG